MFNRTRPSMRSAVVSLFVICVTVSHSTVWAGTYWRYPIEGDWFDGENWITYGGLGGWYTGVPSGIARIDNGGTARIADAGAEVAYLILGSEVDDSGPVPLIDSGTVRLSDGGQLVVNGDVRVGDEGIGTFIHTGGTNTIVGRSPNWWGALRLGYSGGRGTYELSGSGELSAYFVNIENGSDFRQTGGTNDCTYFRLYSDSRYELSGNGQLESFEQQIGSARFVQTGGTNTFRPYGTAWLKLGAYTNSEAYYELGGTGEIVAVEEFIGYYGNGTFIHTSGTNTARIVHVGNSDYAGSGTYNLSGTGELIAENVGVGGRSIGVFSQTGGTNSIRDGLGVGENGTYVLSGNGQLSSGGG